MEPSNFRKVAEFHKAFNLPIQNEPTVLDRERENLRNGFIVEEFCERLVAQGYDPQSVRLFEVVWDWLKKQPKIHDVDLVEVADALSDLLYFIYGDGLEYGIELDSCFGEVHRSNMSKLGDDGKPIYREDGKVLKGPNFFKPNLRAILFTEDEGE